MSLLSYNELCKLVERGVITNVEHDQINATSIDITLGETMLFESAMGEVAPLDYRAREALPTSPQYLTQQGIFLAPGEFVLAQSQQVFNLPNDISAEYKLKSSMARIGLEHLNAGWCFVAGTKVSMLDGSEKPIEEIKEGEEVYSLDSEGRVRAGKVTRAGKTADVSSTVRVVLDDGAHFDCTADHRIMLRDGAYAKASDLTAGQALMPLNRRYDNATGHENHKVSEVLRIEHETPVPVYDITVETYRNFALSAGVFVHNCDAGWNGSVLTLELKNMTKFHTILLRPGDRIGQMVFFKHAPVPAGRSYAARGRYNGDKTVSGVKE